MNAELGREPVALLEDGGDVVEGAGSRDNPGSRVLDRLKLTERFVRKAKQKGVMEAGG